MKPGASTAVNDVDGQTGSRKALTYKELLKAQGMMNKAGVPKNDRYCVMESSMYQQFVDSLTTNLMAAYQATANLAEGVCGRFAGFTIYERATVLAFNASGTAHVPGAALDATSDLACLCWQKESVAKANGTIVPFQEIGSPTYYGDIFSALVKMGGRCRRQGWEGVICILQAGSAPTITTDSTISTTSAAATVKKAVAISTGDNWAVVNDDATDDWFTVSKDGDSVKVVFQANTASGAAARSGSCTISIPGTTVTKQITISQSA